MFRRTLGEFQLPHPNFHSSGFMTCLEQRSQLTVHTQIYSQHCASPLHSLQVPLPHTYTLIGDRPLGRSYICGDRQDIPQLGPCLGMATLATIPRLTGIPCRNPAIYSNLQSSRGGAMSAHPCHPTLSLSYSSSQEDTRDARPAALAHAMTHLCAMG